MLTPAVQYARAGRLRRRAAAGRRTRRPHVDRAARADLGVPRSVGRLGPRGAVAAQGHRDGDRPCESAPARIAAQHTRVSRDSSRRAGRCRANHRPGLRHSAITEDSANQVLTSVRAELLIARGRAGDAVATMSELLREIEHETPRGGMVPAVARLLATALLARGRTAEALEKAQFAARLGRSVDVAEWAAGLRVAGECLAIAGNPEQARARFAEALSVLRGTEFGLERKHLREALHTRRRTDRRDRRHPGFPAGASAAGWRRAHAGTRRWPRVPDAQRGLGAGDPASRNRSASGVHRGRDWDREGAGRAAGSRAGHGSVRAFRRRGLHGAPGTGSPRRNCSALRAARTPAR